MQAFIAVNQTAVDIPLEQLRLVVPASGQVTLSQFEAPWRIMGDSDLLAHVLAGELLINDGTTTLTQAESIQYLRPLATLPVLASSSAPTTTTSATDVLMAGMSSIPAAGTYLVWFSGDLSQSNNGATVTTSLYVNGVLLAESQRTWQRPGSSAQGSFACNCKITVDGTQVVEGRWRRSAGTATNTNRQLVLLRVQ